MLILSISNDGLICLGNGTPVSLLTIGGTAVIDIHGLITNQRIGSAGLVATTGSITVTPGSVGVVTTISGVRPVVQVEGAWPARSTLFHTSGPLAGTCTFTLLYGVEVHMLQAVGIGSFSIVNMNQPDSSGNCPTGQSDSVTYRWM